MFGQQLIEVLSFVGNVTAVAWGLWIAISLEQPVSDWLFGHTRQLSRSGRFIRVLLWLALGYLIALPLFHLLSSAQSLAFSFLPQYSQTQMTGTVWGSAPYWVWAAINTTSMLLVYGLFMYVAASGLRSRIMSLDTESISTTTANLLLLTMAGIVWESVRTILSLVLRPEIPALVLTAPTRGTIGFIGGWLVAALTLVTIGLYHSSQQSQQSQTGKAG